MQRVQCSGKLAPSVRLVRRRRLLEHLPFQIETGNDRWKLVLLNPDTTQQFRIQLHGGCAPDGFDAQVGLSRLPPLAGSDSFVATPAAEAAASSDDEYRVRAPGGASLGAKPGAMRSGSIAGHLLHLWRDRPRRAIGAKAGLPAWMLTATDGRRCVQEM
jgi:hypothetical protein